MKRLLISLALMIAIALPAMAVGSITQTSALHRSTGLLTVTFSWTADSGDGTVPSTATDAAITASASGYFLYQVETDPGSPAPTAAYDIVINDAGGADLMGAALADRSATVTEVAFPATASRQVDTALTLVITANSVHSATGTVKLYLTLGPGR